MAANTLNDRLTAAGKKLVAVVAVVVGVIHLLNVTGTLVMSTLTLRVIHLMAMLVIVLLGGKKAAPTLAAGLTRAALALCAVVCSVYPDPRRGDRQPDRPGGQPGEFCHRLYSCILLSSRV